MDNRMLLETGAKELGIELSSGQIDQYYRYYELLVEWNEKMNLTGITEEREVMVKHFLDSLGAVVEGFQGDVVKVIDVGTGAGFPGYPIKIALPSIHLTALDALNKRINFLDTVSEELGLEDVECIHSRAEDGAKDEELREQFDFCVSRAVADLTVLAEYCLPFVKVGGQFISLKGPSISQEIEKAKAGIEILGGEIVEVRDVKIPYSDLAHNLVIINKVKTTPLKYPRKPSKIKKRPL